MEAAIRTSPSWLVWTGTSAILASVVYVAATLGGSTLDPGYSQIRQHVSDLTATGATTWAALAPAYAVYNVLTLAFGVGLYRAVARTMLFKLGLAALTLNVVAGLLMITVYREDSGGTPITAAGTGHIVLAGVSSLSIVAVAIILGLAFRRTNGWRGLSTFSFAIAGGFLVLGPLAALASAKQSDLAGLAERGPIGLFILWLTVVGLYAIVRARKLSRTAGVQRHQVA